MCVLLNFWWICLVCCTFTPTWKVFWDSEVSVIQTFYLLWRSDMMWRKGHNIHWDQFLAKHLQYLQPVVTFWTCVLVSDEIIPKQIIFGVFSFVILFYLFFTKKSYLLSVLCEVMSPRYVSCHWRKTYKNFYKRDWCVPNSLI